MASSLESLSKFGNWNLPLRIQRRGNFFSDELFKDSRRHFESAAKDLLQDFDLGGTEDAFRSYRRLRDRQLSGTDRAAKIAEESDKYKIVMDVEGFTDGDLQVKVSGPNEIVVEGSQEVKNDSGTFSKRSFKRRFSLPGLALVEDATSSMSSDNVLTVNVPKKIQEITNQSQQSTTTAASTKSSEIKDLESEIRESIQKAKQDLSSSFLSSDLKSQDLGSSFLSSDLKSQDLGSSLLSSDLKSSTLADNIWDLKIVPRKSFFDDSYFENVRQNFQKSVEDMMAKRQTRINSVGDVGIFKKVRETKEENVQAISVTEDAKEHKIVLDVHGFSEGDLKVRAVSENELVVEGSVEKKSEYTVCTHTFNRKFVLPSRVNIRQASSALSSEGILTIIVPKQLESIDYDIPVRTEAASRISNIIKKEQEKKSTAASLNTEKVQQETSTTSARITEAQTLLDNLEKTLEVEKKFGDKLQKREHFVPIDLEGKEAVNVSEARKDTTFETSQTSDVVKEAQRIVSESNKLMEDLAASERRTIPSEHYVPVQLDAGITTSTTSGSSKIASTETQSSTTSQNKISNVTDSQQKFSQSETPSDIFQTHPLASRNIPITLRGSFYKESIFDDARKSIERQVEDVFEKYRKTSALVDESKKSSTLQQISSQSDSQDTASALVKNGQTTSTILDDNRSYKIVLDVFGFEEKELSVKVSGVNEISVEGNSEKSKEGSISKHSFQRSFQLPEYVDLERTSTALSEEGILTVTVPKKNQILPLDKRECVLKKRLHSTEEVSKDTLVVDSSGIVQDTRHDVISPRDSVSQARSDISTSQTISSSPLTSQETQISGQRKEYIVPVSIEEFSDVGSEAGSVQSTSNLSSQISTVSAVSDTSKDVSQNILSTSTSASSIDSQIQDGSKTHDSDKVIAIENLNTASAGNKTSTVSTFNDQSKDISTKSLFSLPIIPKGHFFDDNFFLDSRSMFESMLRNKMNRFNRSTSFIDDLGFFNSLRKRRITGGNQAATFSEDDFYNKIVLDVHGFDESDLKIRALSENEIVIEGNSEEKTGNSLSRKTFRKHFVLPGSVNLRGSTSALSSDGVLNIKIPKSL